MVAIDALEEARWHLRAASEIVVPERLAAGENLVFGLDRGCRWRGNALGDSHADV